MLHQFCLQKLIINNNCELLAKNLNLKKLTIILSIFKDDNEFRSQQKRLKLRKVKE